ncbi:MAG: hypothetical protein IJO31_07990 [Oscillospiraceae bacterium]|nr:hypothetical protein [Oscillospiraceae bacterium]
MCRKNQMWGRCAIGFGLGLLTGCSMESGFWCCALGIGVIIAGFVCMQRK